MQFSNYASGQTDGQTDMLLITLCTLPGGEVTNQLTDLITYDYHPSKAHTHTQPFYCSAGICPGPPG